MRLLVTGSIGIYIMQYKAKIRLTVMKDDLNQSRDKPSYLSVGYHYFRIIIAAILAVFLVLVIWKGKDLIHPDKHRTLSVYCFTGMKEVMEYAILPAFKEHWRDQTGESVEYISTFAGSGDITQKIISRFPMEVAIFASELDSLSLSSRGIAFIRQGKDLPHGGILNRTPLVILTRPDNAFNLRDFSDLTQAGVGIAYPNPSTSGAGHLGLIAIYGSSMKRGATQTEAMQAVQAVWRNVVDKPSSAVVDLDHFRNGVGDVMITYESNLLSNPRRPQVEGRIVYPQTTILCEPTVRAIRNNVSSSQEELVDAFISFLWSEEAQKAFVRYGAHSVDESLNDTRSDFGSLQQTFTIHDIGNPHELDQIVNSVSGQ